jgi:hypothetical protein
MTASEAKELSDKVNADHIDHADADIDHVFIEIQVATERGDYKLEYTFVKDVDYSLVNEIRNQLSGLGYEINILETKHEGKDTYTLDIDWSKEV